ncbi:hypothetical protein LOTGIDRAFT_176647 [Lottia gigantea]|uniref:HMG box domain-containing protein n=1 Tax=Lottia gigantea TaxID=225164 RepID=V4C338_LOTGI|nr:hypothetical protein LOTGIDRAFT_176647 [Lottia gigantea]ESO95914.1 hypothetical protein LOTGIDRAFT_176647 [Lottia gigantea]
MDLCQHQEPSPLLIKASEDLLGDADDSQDGKSDLALSLDENSQTPSEKPKKRQSVKRQPSGYIVYAGEMRKQITHENPEATFGEISRLVGTRWRALPREDKEKYEERAKVLAAQQAVKQQEADKAFNDTLNRSQSPWSESGHISPGSSGRPNTPDSSTSIFL